MTQIDCNFYKPIDWRRGYTKLLTSPLWNPHPNGPFTGSKMPLPFAGTKYSTTFASGFQAMSQTASALAYELLKPQFTPHAPMGCLQYFTQTSGIIESFNFGQYLNNMDYSVCIQRQPETCRVLFTSSDYDWSINGVGISSATSGVGDQDCARDYLLIPGASRTGDGFTYDRYCGGRLHFYRGQTLSSPVVIKTAGPIVLRFHSDAHYEPLNSGGFRLQYDQSAQDCIYHSAEESGSLASQQLLASTLSDSRPLSPEPPVLYASQQLASKPELDPSSVQLASDTIGTAEIQPVRQSLDSSVGSSIKRADFSNSDIVPPVGWTLGANQHEDWQSNSTRRNFLASSLSDVTKAFELISFPPISDSIDQSSVSSNGKRQGRQNRVASRLARSMAFGRQARGFKWPIGRL